jgi:hypothetical protein
VQHLHFLYVGGLGCTKASHHHDGNSRRAQKLAHKFLPLKIGGGPSLPPDAFRLAAVNIRPRSSARLLI